MKGVFTSSWLSRGRQWIASLVILFFSACPATTYAQTLIDLPAPGTMVAQSQAFSPVMVRAIKIRPEEPLVFDFIVDNGNTGLEGTALKAEVERIAKYFLATVTIPEKDLWVNLSPYEKDRILPDELALTEMGRGMLSQDYILKQLASSLVHPDTDLGKEFWQRVYAKAKETLGTTEIPMDTFNKVWIVPEKAVVYERDNAAVLGETHLKLMMEEDYVAFKKGGEIKTDASDEERSAVSKVSSQVMREIVLPEIEKEVNQGENFALLRQMYGAMILATWYKETLKDSLLAQVYADQKKTAGVTSDDRNMRERIFEQYVSAYRQGAFNFIREDKDPASGEMVPRKYFSGGEDFLDLAQKVDEQKEPLTPAVAVPSVGSVSEATVALAETREVPVAVAAVMTDEEKGELLAAPNLPQVIKDNIQKGAISSQVAYEAIKAILDVGEQENLLADFDAPGVEDLAKNAFLEEVAQLSHEWNGGFKAYKELVRTLVAKNHSGEDPTKGKKVSPPRSQKISGFGEEYQAFTREGLKYITHTAFLKVMAGNAQRFGLPKWQPRAMLPVNPVTGKSFLQEDIEQVVALASLSETGAKMPFIAMVSPEAVEGIRKFLEERNYFGMNGVSVINSYDKIADDADLKQIILFAQPQVPSVQDVEGKFIKEAGNKYQMVKSPAGHGMIHAVAKKMGLFRWLEKRGFSHTLFLQDTNATVWNAVLPTLAETVKQHYAFNFVGVASKPGEEAGRLMTLEGPEGSITRNVEYTYFKQNPGLEQTDPVSGYSIYPGNINVFFVDNKAWADELERSETGLFAFLFNPKFPKPARPETNMQDGVLALSSERVGVTIFEPRDVFDAVKNDVDGGKAAVAKGVIPETLAWASGEKFVTMRKILAQVAGVKFTGAGVDGKTVSALGNIWNEGAIFSYNPLWAPTNDKIGERINGLTLGERAVVDIDGITPGLGMGQVDLHNVSVNGGLFIKVAPGVRLVVEDLDVSNKGVTFVPLTEAEVASKETPVEAAKRGYWVKTQEAMVVKISVPGDYVLTTTGLWEKENGALLETTGGSALTRNFSATDEAQADVLSSNFQKMFLEKAKAGEAVIGLIKPDGQPYEDSLVGEIRATGLRVTKGPKIRMSVEDARAFYAEHYDVFKATQGREKAWWPKLEALMTSGEVTPLFIEGPGAVKVMTELKTKVRESDGRYGKPDSTANRLHGSDKPASAEREAHLMFDKLAAQEQDMLTGKFPGLNADAAQTRGGIDFDPALLNMQVERTGTGIRVHVDPAEIQRIRTGGVDGFAPVIINIMPVKGIVPALGLRDQSGQLAGVAG